MPFPEMPNVKNFPYGTQQWDMGVRDGQFTLIPPQTTNELGAMLGGAAGATAAAGGVAGALMGAGRGDTAEGLGRGLVRGGATGAGAIGGAALGNAVGKHINPQYAGIGGMLGAAAGGLLGYGGSGAILGEPEAEKRKKQTQVA